MTRFTAILLATLLHFGAAFIHSPGLKPMGSFGLSLAAVNKDANTNPSNENKPNGIKEFLKIIVTGSPDGVALLGKPQINWSTGKAYTKEEQTKARTIYWNALNSAKTAKDINKKP
jgi:hypothetical protein